MHILTLEIVSTNLPTSVLRGQQLSVAVNVQNVYAGDLNAQVKYYVNSGGGPLVLMNADQGIVNIPAGDTLQFTFTFTTPAVKGGLDDGTPFTEFSITITALDDTGVSDTKTYTITIQELNSNTAIISTVISVMLIVMLMQMVMKQ